MKKLEIIGFKRANLGKTESKRLRMEANVPCVLYGGKEQVHFYAPMFLFRDLVYTPEVHKVDLSIDGAKYECILQDIQFHPVNEMIVHADFLQLQKDRKVTMQIPFTYIGQAPGVFKGGKLTPKLHKVAVKALPDNLPASIEVDVSALELNKSIKVGDIKSDKFVILKAKGIPVVSVEVPRALKLGDEETAVAATTTEAAAPAAAPAADAKAADKGGDAKKGK